VVFDAPPDGLDPKKSVTCCHRPSQDGLRVWRHTSPAKRADIILRAARLARERVEETAIAMTLEQGKPIAQSRLEILRGCDIIE
jgi:succinate-semialdehyde dehydrogenase / glutarate-semialdehyde dehydrogenase